MPSAKNAPTPAGPLSKEEKEDAIETFKRWQRNLLGREVVKKGADGKHVIGVVWKKFRDTFGGPNEKHDGPWHEIEWEIVWDDVGKSGRKKKVELRNLVSGEEGTSTTQHLQGNNEKQPFEDDGIVLREGRSHYLMPAPMRALEEVSWKFNQLTDAQQRAIWEYEVEPYFARNGSHSKNQNEWKDMRTVSYQEHQAQLERNGKGPSASKLRTAVLGDGSELDCHGRIAGGSASEDEKSDSKSGGGREGMAAAATGSRKPKAAAAGGKRKREPQPQQQVSSEALTEEESDGPDILLEAPPPVSKRAKVKAATPNAKSATPSGRAAKSGGKAAASSGRAAASSGKAASAGRSRGGGRASSGGKPAAKRGHPGRKGKGAAATADDMTTTTSEETFEEAESGSVSSDTDAATETTLEKIHRDFMPKNNRKSIEAAAAREAAAEAAAEAAMPAQQLTSHTSDEFHDGFDHQEEAERPVGAGAMDGEENGQELMADGRDPYTTDGCIWIAGFKIPRNAQEDHTYTPGDTLYKDYRGKQFPEDQEFKPERIVAQRAKGAKLEYLVKWHTFELDPDDFNPHVNLAENRVLDDWEALHPPKYGSGNAQPRKSLSRRRK